MASEEAEACVVLVTGDDVGRVGTRDATTSTLRMRKISPHRHVLMSFLNRVWHSPYFLNEQSSLEWAAPEISRILQDGTRYTFPTLPKADRS